MGIKIKQWSTFRCASVIFECSFQYSKVHLIAIQYWRFSLASTEVVAWFSTRTIKCSVQISLGVCLLVKKLHGCPAVVTVRLLPLLSAQGLLRCKAGCYARMVVMQGWLGCKPPSTVTCWYQPERKISVWRNIYCVGYTQPSSISKQRCVQNSTKTEFISPFECMNKPQPLKLVPICSLVD